MTGNRLREIRRARGLTQAQLAECVGVSQLQVGRWEMDYRGIPLVNAVAIADALGVTLDALAGRDDSKGQQLRKSYDELSSEGRSRLLDYAHILDASGMYKPD